MKPGGVMSVPLGVELPKLPQNGFVRFGVKGLTVADLLARAQERAEELMRDPAGEPVPFEVERVDVTPHCTIDVSTPESNPQDTIDYWVADVVLRFSTVREGGWR